MKLFLLRGPSGSGKSTISEALATRYNGTPGPFLKIETDQFFTDAYGNYRFNQTALGVAHDWCRLSVERGLSLGYNVIVANTNMSFREIEPYIMLADRYNYETEIYRTPRPWDYNVLFKRNLHNVPLDVLKRQIARYQEHPDEKEWSDLSIYE